MEHCNPLQVSFDRLSYSVRVPSKGSAKEATGDNPFLRVLKTPFAKSKDEEKTILHNLSGGFRPGRVTAILGPSGSGKTTLLNLLSGYVTAGTTTGNIWVNGRPATGASMRLLAGYVNQDDVILSTQTVQEAIQMSIILRPPPVSSASYVPNVSDGTDNPSSSDTIGIHNSGAVNIITTANNDDTLLPLPATMSNAANSKQVASVKENVSVFKNKECRSAEHGANAKAGLKQERASRCANAIAQFGLDKCKDTRVGDSSEKGISGGERKRTAIAMEWVTQAPILFLDEPTSGLDAHSAMMVTSHLRSIARTGRTVIAVVHQPSSEMFEMIDDILILYEGRIVYLGERAHLTDYLAKLGFPCGMYTNPADHVFNSVLFGSTAEFKDQTKQEEKASERARYLMDSWEGSNEAARVRALIDDPDLTPIQETQFRRKSPAFVQFKYLIKRSARNALRNKMVLHIRLAQGIILGLLLGLIYLNTQNRPVNVQQQNFSGALFFSAASQFILAMISVVDVFSQERVVFLREWRASYYGLPAYYFSKNFIEIPIQIVVAIIYSCINYWLLGFRRDAGRFFIYMVSCMAVNMCGFSVGMFLASICKNMSAILGAIPLIVVPTLLFGGLFVNTGNSTVWLRWIQWLSPIKYSFAATMKNQFDGYNVDGKSVGDAYLKDLELGPFSIAVDIIMIFVIGFVIWLAAYLALLYSTRKGHGGFKKSASVKAHQAGLLGAPDSRFAQKSKEANKVHLPPVSL